MTSSLIILRFGELLVRAILTSEFLPCVIIIVVFFLIGFQAFVQVFPSFLASKTCIQVFSNSIKKLKTLLVLRGRLKESEVMKVVVWVLLVCTALCNGAYMEYEDYYQYNLIDDNKDTKSILKTCTEKGSKSSSCKYSTFLGSVTRQQQNMCEMAFKLACSVAQESTHCAEGQTAARYDEKCENLHSDVSKVTCFGTNR